MSWRSLAYVVGAVVLLTGAGMGVAAGVALLYAEWSEAGGIGVAAAITLGLGSLMRWGVGRIDDEVSLRKAFGATGLAWFAMAGFGMLPYLLTGAIDGPTNAFFEGAAGFTTTGATVVPDPAALSHGILFWRSLTQWIGGMGIIVLSVVVLPLLGTGGLQLARAEWPGGQPERLTPRFRETAKRLWGLYAGLTVLLVALYGLGDMDLFQAVAHALTTMPTGGFGTTAGSLGDFGPYVQWVAVVFMFIAGVAFPLHYRALARPWRYLGHPEFRAFLVICLAAVALVTFGTWSQGPPAVVVREASFTAVAIVTTTGYAVTDFAQWSAGLQVLLLGLMFVGGMAGSTSGSIKVFRLLVMSRASVTNLRRILHPRAVFVTRFAGKRVDDDVLGSIQSFFLFYVVTFMVGTLLLAIIESGIGVGEDLVTSASAVSSALGNVGPGLGLVGPASNYLAIQPAGKWLLSLLMIVGRLEIFPVLVLFVPDLWKR